MTVKQWMTEHEIAVVYRMYGGGTDGCVWWNETSQDILLKKGYPTVANGSASDITVPAGKGLIKEYKGDPEEFARYAVVSVEDAKRFKEEYLGQ